MKLFGPRADRCLSGITRGGTIQLFVCVLPLVVSAVSNYHPVSLIPWGLDSVDGVSSQIPNLV